MPTQNNIQSLLANHHLVPVVTFQEHDDPIAFMNFLIHQDVNCIEITLRTSEGIKAIELLKQESPENFLVGAGTVTNKDQILQLKQLNADFIVSPGLTSKLQTSMEQSGIPYLPGVTTPSEVMKAKEMGLNALKFFPANLYGGAKALQTYGNLFPDVNFCPTGGVTKETSKDYLELNNVFAVGGSWFQSEYNKKLI